jgi:HSP20 family protein
MVNTLKRDDWAYRQDVERLQQEMERLRKRALRPVRRRGDRVFPSVIISATEEMLVVRAEVPGMDLQAFDITVSGDNLTIRGTRLTGEGLEGGWYHRRERESGSFSRAIRLPAEVDGNRAEATYIAGVLAITLPLREAAKPREIPVTVAEG